IGDIAVSQSNPDLLYVGSGESNNRQSTSWGDGVYKSTDGGKTYTNVGLRTSRHINRIVIDPRNNDVVWVAATGPLFGPGGGRGTRRGRWRRRWGRGTWRRRCRGSRGRGRPGKPVKRGGSARPGGRRRRRPWLRDDRHANDRNGTLPLG